jgi:hypothetical protein
MSGLTFEEKGHRYFYDGRPTPGVTSIIEPLNDYGSVPKATLDRAAERGRDVHTMCEYHEQGVLIDYDPAYQGYLDAWKRFLAETGWVTELSETMVYHHLYHYAGTIDRVGAFGGSRRCVLDLKTTAKFMPSVGPQTAAYKLAWNDQHTDGSAHHGLAIHTRACVRLTPLGDYELHQLTSPRDVTAFQACLQIDRWRRNL